MKKFHFTIIAFVCLFLASCAVIPVTYFGDRLTPTTSIDIFYSAHDVKREYKVIGHLTCTNYTNQETVKTYLSDYAKKIGADAVVILGSDALKNAQDAVINADALKYDK